jgi:aspartyl aminopeptidase
MTPPAVDGLLKYLAASPSPYHAVRSAVQRLEAAGWQQLSMQDAWSDIPAKSYVSTGGALIAWNGGG